ncbi:MAG: AraC family transcriptional regulator [Microscillaceae bacterium]|jgi:AraC family transcriptional regulator|nr:AraC family transcriptional regulator [Microscillaceae bacterium]
MSELKKNATIQFYTESVHQAIAFLEAHYTENILLDDIADFACLSPFHFHRIFKIITNHTAKQVLNRIRLEKSAQMLRYTPTEVAQIGIIVGYENPETFTRAFKNYFGIPPSQYRQQASETIVHKQQQYLDNQINMATLRLSKPEIKFLEPLHLAYIRHTGSYEQVGKVWRKLLFWAFQHLQYGKQTATMGIVHDNPEITDTHHTRYDAGIVVKKPMQSTRDIHFKSIAGGRYAVFRYQGAYDDFYTVYDYVYSICLSEFGFRLRNEPSLEWYIKFPPFYKPENYLTDFYVPIE